MAVIDNKSIKLKDALNNILPTSDRIDIFTAYFYFGGFSEIYKAAKDKKIRLLIGKELDLSAIDEITKALREDNGYDLSDFASRKKSGSLMILEENILKTLSVLINETELFDKEGNYEALEIFFDKIRDGTLEIRKTIKDEHAKFYISHNKPLNSQNGDYPGTVIMGSSNFTSRGLSNQGELNEVFRDREHYNTYLNIFEEQWNDSNSIKIADIKKSEKFIDFIKKNTWIFNVQKPYDIYNRILNEIFKEVDYDILTPSKITSGKYSNLLYQIDAVKMAIDKLNKYDGAIIADVVGLGKSVIAATVAKNLEQYEPFIICPPHLIDQWKEYRSEFKLKGDVYSSGNIKKIFSEKKNTLNQQLIIIDEAHKFRNEDTTDYKLLHQIVRGHPNNKVLLLTATPFSNQPSDIFSLIKLFQIPGYSTLRTVNNLSIKFKELIKRYKRIRKIISENKYGLQEEAEAKEIAMEQRKIIENVIIRRSRIDLKKIERYKDDLEKQNIKFPEIEGPILIDFELKENQKDYIDTLKMLSDETIGFKGARYNPAKYIIDDKLFQDIFGLKPYETELQVSQIDLGSTIRRLLIMRFESSLYSFKNTLNKMIRKYQIVVDNFTKSGDILIGDLEEIDELLESDFDYKVDEKIKKIPKSVIVNIKEFESDLLNDFDILKKIYKIWFTSRNANDYKTERLQEIIKEKLKENGDRKIVIFSNYADTVDYLYNQLSHNMKRVVKYTSKELQSKKKYIISDFDASYDENRKTNDFDVLICTDTLSEGLNLNRAGIVINYDIPYNPTRVIQRVGRINRINKKMFDKILILNFFPTPTGETEVKIKLISTLKILLINSIIGSDTKHLTDSESLRTFFKNSFDEELINFEDESWDTKHLNNYFKFKHNQNYIDVLNAIPRRSRLAREAKSNFDSIVFAKKNDDVIFMAKNNIRIDHIGPEVALNVFIADDKEKGFQVSKELNLSVSDYVESITTYKESAEITGKRSETLKVLKFLMIKHNEETLYLKDLVKIIQDYDDLSEGLFKDILNLDLKNDSIIKDLKQIVPETLVKNIISKADKLNENKEIIMMIEELNYVK